MDVNEKKNTVSAARSEISPAPTNRMYEFKTTANPAIIAIDHDASVSDLRMRNSNATFLFSGKTFSVRERSNSLISSDVWLYWSIIKPIINIANNNVAV